MKRNRFFFKLLHSPARNIIQTSAIRGFSIVEMLEIVSGTYLQRYKILAKSIILSLLTSSKTESTPIVERE